MVLYELLWQIAFAYTYELRPYLDLLLYMLCIEDSWQTHRIHKALKGIPDDHSSRDGLFETIQTGHRLHKNMVVLNIFWRTSFLEGDRHTWGKQR